MKLNILVLIVVLFTVISCNSKKEDSTSNNESIAFIDSKIDQSESYLLFKNKCYACHSVKSRSHDEIIAPPMAA